MANLADVSAETPALGPPEGPEWSQAPPPGWRPGAGHITDTAGEGDRRCLNPVTYGWDSAGGVRNIARRRCTKCQSCIAQKKRVRIRRTMNEVDDTRRTWAVTCTASRANWRGHLLDESHRNRKRRLRPRNDPRDILSRASVCDDAASLQRWDDEQMQRIKEGFVKRLRRNGGKLRQSTNWERHESEQRHAHQFTHEIDKPITQYQLIAATYIYPRGRAYPRRSPGESQDAWWKRVCRGPEDHRTLSPGNRHAWHKLTQREDDHLFDERPILEQHTADTEHRKWRPSPDQWKVIKGDTPWTPLHGLYCGHWRWIVIRDDQSPEARAERLRLPIQVMRASRKAIFLTRDNTRRNRTGGKAVHYAAKFVGYSTKEGGRWSASPGYGNRPEGRSWPKGQNGGAAEGNPGLPSRAHSSQEWCRGAASEQELGPNGPRSIPPRPPSTAPPPPEEARPSSIAQSWVEEILLRRNHNVHDREQPA